MMLDPNEFLSNLVEIGVDFYTGVPDSLLKEFCACVTSNLPRDKHVISSNEGAAVGLALGYHLGTGKVPLVYMQNSGLGNIINPLLSLASSEVYAVPMLLMIGWRGEPGVKDEPQHIHQGRVMLEMLTAMNIPHNVISNDNLIANEQVQKSFDQACNISGPVAMIIKKELFNKYPVKKSKSQLSVTREDAIIAAASKIIPNSVIVSTTGMASRELFEYREANKLGHHRDFLTVGGMGHASQIALGIAMSQPERAVYCFDGDGAALMHMGSMAISGKSSCANFVHLVFNNGVHASVGGQPTLGFQIDFCQVAKSCGYKNTIRTDSILELNSAIEYTYSSRGPHFIEVRTLPDNRKDIGRPTTTPKQNKIDLMKFIGAIR